MKIIFGLITGLMCVSLVSVPVYSQELTEREKNILYDAMEQEISLEEQMMAGNNNPQVEDLATKYGLSEAEMQDIVTRAKNMPFTSSEKAVAEELRQELASLPEDSPNPEVPAILKELASRYNMRLGQVGLILLKIQGDEE